MPSDTFRVGEIAASKILLARAIETEDRDAVVLTVEDRRYASNVALSKFEGNSSNKQGTARFLVRRAESLLERLGSRFPDLKKYAAAIHWPLWLSVGVPFAALLLGLSTNAFAGRQLNIVAFPLLGLIAWNLAVFVSLAMHWTLRLIRRKDERSGWLGNAARRLLSPRSSLLASQPTLERGLIRFARDWSTTSGALTDARLRRTLHLGAALFAAGMIAAMLLRARYMAEYEAGWAGTWSGAEQEIANALRIILGPASLLTDIPLPTAEQLQELRGRNQNAGNWLLLWSVTATLLVIIPRLVLALISGIKSEVLRHSLAVRQDFHIRSVLRDALGEPGQARVIAYAVDLTKARRQRLEHMLQAVLGERTRVNFDPPVAYGSEDEWLEKNVDALSGSDYLILLFSLSSTPEAENHGAFAGSIRSHVAGAPTSLIVLLEEGTYRTRLQGSPSSERRLIERSRAWNAVLAEANLQPIPVALKGLPEEDAVEALERALLRLPANLG